MRRLKLMRCYKASTLLAFVAGLAILARAQDVTDLASGKPSYGAGFPELSVDYFGLMKLSELEPPAKHKASLEAILSGDGAVLIEDLLQVTTDDQEDVWSFFLLVHAAATGDRLREVASELERRSSIAYNKNIPAQTLHLASYYSIAMVAARSTKDSGEVIGLNVSRLKGIETPADRLSIMMLVSVKWMFINANAVRGTAARFLLQDPDFYQLRTLYAYSMGFGAGPVTRSDGTTVPRTAFRAYVEAIQQNIAMVIRCHPDYVPAYYVATGGASKPDAIAYAEFFLSQSDSECKWHKSAKTLLEFLRKGRS